MSLSHKLVMAGVLFAAALGTGFWLGAAGTVAHALLMGTHKLLSLAAVVFVVMLAVHALRTGATGPLNIAALIVLLLSAVALIASGSVLTVPKLSGASWLNLHRVASVLGALALAVTARLLTMKP
ncbi:MAG: hypothetical protein WCE75_13185 [Terracidiphilus sp.]